MPDDPANDLDPVAPTADTGPDRAQQARDYEAAHNRLFLLQIVVTVALIIGFVASDLSGTLADGLRDRFGERWWWTNALYLIIVFFGFAALIFPITLYSDFLLEHRYGLSKQHLNSWFSDYLKGLLLEVGLSALFFSAVYALLQVSPEWWWLWTTVLYSALSVVLSALWPVLIMPLFHQFEPLEESELTSAVRHFVEKAGLTVLGVYRWGLEEKTETANAALTGLGRTRRIILADTMLDKYSKEEIVAVLAHEVGHHRHRDLWRLMAMGTALAGLGFYIAHRVLQMLVAQFGYSGIADIGAFPLFIFSLFVFSLISMPLSNAYSRKREYAADAYAVDAVGTPEPLINALEKLADQNLADKEPAAWIEWLLHGHPSIKRRIERARGLMQSARN